MPQNTSVSQNTAPSNFSGYASANGGGVGSDAQPRQVMSEPDVNVTPQGTQYRDNSAGVKDVKPHHVFQSIMETLAGPQYKYSINPNTGEMEKVPVQRSKSTLANSIVAGALTGLFAGAGERGPGAFTRGIGKGGQASVAMHQNMDQSAQNMAKDEYARRTLIFENNLRMHQNQLNISNMDYDIHKKLTDDDNSLYDEVKDIPGFITTGEMTEDEAKKFDPTMHNVMRRRVVENGKNSDGSTHWENTYVGVNPNAVGDAPEGVIADAKKWGFLPTNFPNEWRTKAYMMSNLREKTASADVFQHVLDKFSQGYTVKTGTPLKSPDIADPKIASLIDSAAQKYNLPPAILRGLVSIESGGNPDAIGPKTKNGEQAVGLGQVMPSTAKGYGVDETQLKDAGTNIDVAAHYLRDLLDKNNQDPKLALAHYHGIGSDGKTTDSQYVNKIAKLVGLDNKSEFKTKSFEVGDFQQALKDDPTLIKAIQKFPFGIAANSGVGDALKAMQTLEDSGKIPNGYTAKVTDLFGAENVKDYTQHQEIEKKAQQTAADTEARVNAENSPEAIQASVNKTIATETAKQDLQNKNLEVMHNVLESGGPNFQLNDQIPNASNMSPVELKQALQAKGVTIPDNFDALYGTAHYKVNPGTYAPRVWQKGTPHEMDAQTAKSYILKYINPQYDDSEFPSRQKFRSELYSGQSQDGKALRNAGTAVQHLQLLQDASEALKRGNIPLLNRLAQSFDVNIGKSAPLTFQAVAEKVSQEVEKVAMGGNVPYVGQLQSGLEKLRADASPEQTASVVDAYTKLMYGRINAIDEASQSQLQEHLHNVSPEVTKLFQQHGLKTAWDNKQYVQNTQNAVPQGATGQVKDKAGNWHWTDGKQDLGLVQGNNQ